jgi:hypothetical protein
VVTCFTLSSGFCTPTLGGLTAEVVADSPVAALMTFFGLNETF